VLSSPSLYFSSFFEAPICVLKEFVSIQRKFLWGGSEEIRRFVGLVEIQLCLSKYKEGLETKHLDILIKPYLTNGNGEGLLNLCLLGLSF
jgi:hypothetical protein